MPNTSADSVVVAALYRFVALPDFEDLRQPLFDLMTDSQVKGTLLLASEGINGTIAGSRATICKANVMFSQKPPSRDGAGKARHQ